MRILDVGSGRRPCLPLDGRPPGCEYVGLDVSASELEAAPERSYDAKVVADSGVRVEELIGRFDLILSFQVFEHVKPLAKTLDNLRMYLVPGGVLLAQCSGAFSLPSLLNKVIRHKVAVALLVRLLNRSAEKIFPAHYDHCWATALERDLREWSKAEVTPLYRGAAYFHFFKPLRACYLLYEEWTMKRNLRNLAPYYIVEATR